MTGHQIDSEIVVPTLFCTTLSVSMDFFFSPTPWRNIFASHINGAELLNGGLNLLRDTPVVISTSHCPGGFPCTKQHTIRSAWPGSQALPPATHTILFPSGKEYDINCEMEKTDLYNVWVFTCCSRSAATGQRSTRSNGQRPKLTWGAQKPENIYVSFPRTSTKFSAGQQRVMKEGKLMHTERRDGNAIPRAKDGANNCIQRDNDL